MRVQQRMQVPIGADAFLGAGEPGGDQVNGFGRVDPDPEQDLPPALLWPVEEIHLVDVVDVQKYGQGAALLRELNEFWHGLEIRGYVIDL